MQMSTALIILFIVSIIILSGNFIIKVLSKTIKSYNESTKQYTHNPKEFKRKVKFRTKKNGCCGKGKK